MSTERTTISLPSATLNRIDTLAVRNGRSMSNMIGVLLERALSLVEREHPVRVEPKAPTLPSRRRR